MPPQRKSSRKSGPAAKGGQSTLSFGRASQVVKQTDGLKTIHDAKSLKPASKPQKRKLEDNEEDIQVIEPEVEEEVEIKPAPPPPSKEEKAASKISDARLKRYWNTIESERKAKRVHQENLSLNERILRHFDLSSQYGPCIGSDRSRRWARASRLNLDPPIEVLAVLLREQLDHPGASERAYVDELMSR